VAWQLQEAKQRLSEVVRRALEDGPQVVTRHGREAVVVVSVEQFAKLGGDRPDFKEFLREAPDLGRLKTLRDRKRARRVTL
jgi:prevent-host-death family protein